jgi:hypothetical protein
MLIWERKLGGESPARQALKQPRGESNVMTPSKSETGAQTTTWGIQRDDAITGRDRSSCNHVENPTWWRHHSETGAHATTWGIQRDDAITERDSSSYNHVGNTRLWHHSQRSHPGERARIVTPCVHCLTYSISRLVNKTSGFNDAILAGEAAK